MLNVEKYLTDIKINIEDGMFALTKGGNVRKCEDVECKDCRFNVRRDKECEHYIMIWLFMQTQEITEQEYLFCLSVNKDYYLYKRTLDDAISCLPDGTVSLYSQYPSPVLDALIPDLSVLGLKFNGIKRGQAIKVADVIQNYKDAEL